MGREKEKQELNVSSIFRILGMEESLLDRIHNQLLLTSQQDFSEINPEIKQVDINRINSLDARESVLASTSLQRSLDSRDNTITLDFYQKIICFLHISQMCLPGLMDDEVSLALLTDFADKYSELVRQPDINKIISVDLNENASELILSSPDLTDKKNLLALQQDSVLALQQNKYQEFFRKNKKFEETDDKKKKYISCDSPERNMALIKRLNPLRRQTVGSLYGETVISGVAIKYLSLQESAERLLGFISRKLDLNTIWPNHRLDSTIAKEVQGYRETLHLYYSLCIRTWYYDRII